MPLRITSWNVNGIRNPFAYQPWREKRTFQAMFDILEADIVVMQETKIQRKDLKDDMVLVPGWDVFFSLPKHKKGYSGVVIYTRNSTCCPLRAEEGIAGVLSPPNSSMRFRDLPEERQIGGYPRPGQLSSDVDELMLDSEGRCVILEFPAFVLIGTYSPANRDETRVEFRQSFLEALDVRVRNLVAAGKQVILTGDLNVIRSGLDTSNLAESLRKEGMTMDDWMRMPARRLFNQLVFEGNVVGERDEGREQPILWDLGRRFHPGREGMFTCWDTKRNTRPANNGSRIDYILCSSGIKEWFQDSNIQEGLMGSDHCPVFGTLKDTVNFRGQETSLLDLMNPEDMMHNGKRLREWSLKDLLPISARLIPEFDRRQSIRDMFMKKPAPKTPASTPATKPAGHPAQATESPSHSQIEDAVHDKEKSSSQQPPNSTPLLTLDASCDSSGVPPPCAATDSLLTKSIPKTGSKRTVEEAVSPKRTLKKTKTNESDGGLAQSTLKGFFRPKQPFMQPAGNGQAQRKTKEPSDSSTPSPQKPQSADFGAGDPAPNGLLSPNKSLPQSSSISSVSAVDASEKVFDPIQVKESWSKLRLGQRVAPKCEHGEPCISLLTKKPGVNCGRSFYICPRPLGPSGGKETGTEWRCGTFIWSSDWKKDQA